MLGAGYEEEEVTADYQLKEDSCLKLCLIERGEPRDRFLEVGPSKDEEAESLDDGDESEDGRNC